MSIIERTQEVSLFNSAHWQTIAMKPARMFALLQDRNPDFSYVAAISAREQFGLSTRPQNHSVASRSCTGSTNL
jgi:hypothetical protein